MCYICSRVNKGERVEIVSTDYESVYMMRGAGNLSRYERVNNENVFLYLSGTDFEYQKIRNCPFCGEPFNR